MNRCVTCDINPQHIIPGVYEETAYPLDIDIGLHQDLIPQRQVITLNGGPVTIAVIYFRLIR